MQDMKPLTCALFLLWSAGANASQLEIWEFGFVFETLDDYESGNAARLFTRDSDQRLTGLLYSHEKGVYELEIEENGGAVKAYLRPRDQSLADVEMQGEVGYKIIEAKHCRRELRFNHGATFLVMHSAAQEVDCRKQLLNGE